MRLLILLPALLLPAASVAAPPIISSAPDRQATADMPIIDPGGSAESCPPISRYHALQRERRPEAQKLNELPMADHYKTAYRRIGGCEAPIIAGFGAGVPR